MFTSGSLGCDGGMPQQAWRYVKENGGVDNVESYPYEGKVRDSMMPLLSQIVFCSI